MEKLKTGIPGLDRMLDGGIPEGHIVEVLGSPGTGKTILALQFILTGLQNGENCVYLSLEQSEEDILKTAEIFGWNLEPYIANNKLALVYLSPLNIKATLHRVKNCLPAMFKSFDAKRLVIDPITLYEMVQNSESERRIHLLSIVQMIKEIGLTAFITSEINTENPFYSKYGQVEYVSDGIILLQHVRQKDHSAVASSIEVSKMRFIEHSREIKPYSIAKSGIEVHLHDEFFS
jgi:KaiC domain protein